MRRFVEGSYSTQETANLAVESLLAKGFNKSDMTFIANRTAARTLADNSGVRILEVDAKEDDDDDGLWARIKDIFSRSNDKEELIKDDELLRQYHDKLVSGNIILLVESGLDSPLKDKVDENPELNPEPMTSREGRRVIVPPVSPTDSAINTTPMAGETGVVPPLVDDREETDDELKR